MCVPSVLGLVSLIYNQSYQNELMDECWTYSIIVNKEQILLNILEICQKPSNVRQLNKITSVFLYLPSVHL